VIASTRAHDPTRPVRSSLNFDGLAHECCLRRRRGSSGRNTHPGHALVATYQQRGHRMVSAGLFRNLIIFAWRRHGLLAADGAQQFVRVSRSTGRSPAATYATLSCYGIYLRIVTQPTFNRPISRARHARPDNMGRWPEPERLTPGPSRVRNSIGVAVAKARTRGSCGIHHTSTA